MTILSNDQLVTATGGVTQRPDGGTCTDPLPLPGGTPPFNPGSPFNPSGPRIGFPGGNPIDWRTLGGATAGKL